MPLREPLELEVQRLIREAKVVQSLDSRMGLAMPGMTGMLQQMTPIVTSTVLSPHGTS